MKLLRRETRCDVVRSGRPRRTGRLPETDPGSAVPTEPRFPGGSTIPLASAAPGASVPIGFTATTVRMVSRSRILAASSLAVVGGSGCLGTDSGGGTTAPGSPTPETGGASPPTPTVAFGSRSPPATRNGDSWLGRTWRRSARSSAPGRPGIGPPVQLTDDGTEASVSGLERIGAFDDPSAHEIRTYLDGEHVTPATLGRGLAARMDTGEWDGRFLVHVSDRDEAERLQNALDDA